MLNLPEWPFLVPKVAGACSRYAFLLAMLQTCIVSRLTVLSSTKCVSHSVFVWMCFDPRFGLLKELAEPPTRVQLVHCWVVNVDGPWHVVLHCVLVNSSLFQTNVSEEQRAQRIMCGTTIVPVARMLQRRETRIFQAIIEAFQGQRSRANLGRRTDEVQEFGVLSNAEAWDNISRAKINVAMIDYLGESF